MRRSRGSVIVATGRAGFSQARGRDGSDDTGRTLPAVRRVSGVPRIATADRVERDALDEFLRSRHHAILVTSRTDGRPQLSPVTCGLDAAGRIVIATYPQRVKARNARRDPRVSVLVLSDEWDDAWVQVDGTAEVIDLPDAVEPLVEYFRAISGEHPDWDEYRDAMHRQGKCLVRVTIDRWGPIATGGFPPELA
jgi:PPOX class probable F420-dependent enzyme